MDSADLFARPPCVILGVGNTLWADEGFGARMIDLLSRAYDVEGAELVDGGTQGLYLLPIVTEARRLLVFDAVKLGHEPGSIVVLKNDEIDGAFRNALSLHETTFHDLVASARLIGWQPEDVVLIGVEAAETEEWGGGLTPTVAAKLDEIVKITREILSGWGVTLTARAEPRAEATSPFYR